MIRRTALLLVLLSVSLATMAQPARFVEGTHFDVLSTPVRIAATDKIEVTEYFWYGCPACYQFEPRLSAWTENLPADVVFNRLPALGGGIREVHAQAYYTAEALDVIETVHGPMFDAIHREGNRLGNQDIVGDFFTAHGVDRAAFDAAWNSFGVDSGMKRALSQLRQYGSQVQSTPSIIVNGKYVVLNQQDVLDVVDFLIDKERNGS